MLVLRHNWQLLDLEMSQREDLVAPGRGRGSGRNRFESGRPAIRDRGLTSAIGAYFDYALISYGFTHTIFPTRLSLSGSPILFPYTV